MPVLWKKGIVHKGLVIVLSLVPGKSSKKFVSSRDTRDLYKNAMDVRLELCDWSDILGLDDPEECARVLNNRLWTMFDESFPLIRVRVSSRDPP